MSGSRLWGTAKKPLDFGADIAFDKENGTNGKIPVFQREFKVIRPLYEPWRGLKAPVAALGLIGLRNDNKGVKLLDYIYIPVTGMLDNCKGIIAAGTIGHIGAKFLQLAGSNSSTGTHVSTPERGQLGQNEGRGLSLAAGASEDGGFECSRTQQEGGTVHV